MCAEIQGSPCSARGRVLGFGDARCAPIVPRFDVAVPLVLRAFRDLLAAASPEDVMRALLKGAMKESSAAAAVVVERLVDGTLLAVASRGEPPTFETWLPVASDGDVDPFAVGVALPSGRFGAARAFPIATVRGAQTTLVLFFEGDPPATGVAIAEALAGLAAVELERAEQLMELHVTRELLERTEKLRAMGEMTAGISHDLKNILNPLSLHVQLLRRMLKRGDANANDVDGVVDELAHVLRRGVETVDRLREFSKQAPETPLQPVELAGLAHEALELCRPRVASRRRTRGVRLVEDLGAAPIIEARASELLTALVNLIANAIDALEDGGSVTVRTGGGEGGAWVEVTDDGPGVPLELQQRIFEPFFTTKGAAGTGLGLAMVTTSVRRYGGTLTLDTAPGHGSTFCVWLPLPVRRGDSVAISA